LSLLALAAVSCTNTHIKGVVNGAANDKIVAKLLDVNVYNVLDTVKTKADGSFSYDLKLQKGQPEFLYLFKGDTKIASLILNSGDKVKVTADTLGNYSVEGSEESAKLCELEKRFSDFITNFAAAANEGRNAELTPMYLDYYRTSIRTILENVSSLSNIPALYQKVDINFPVFNQNTDAILFRQVCDTLKTIYPESRYVKALEKETVKRENQLILSMKVDGMNEVGYLDVSLPNTQGEKVALSSLDAKVVLVHLWTATDAAQTMFNLDVLKKVYADYHSKGFDIYQIGVDVDKALWASVVRNQGLEWTNVCDGLGSSSPVLSLYPVESLPAAFFIVNGDMVTEPISNEASLRKALNKYL